MIKFKDKLIGRLEELDWLEDTPLEEIINELAEEYKGGWIPCSERLPEKNGYYLVTQKRYSLDTHRLIRIETDYVRFENGEWGRANYFEITAWQPLPAPYKEGCE
jgi:hypothetical protein